MLEKSVENLWHLELEYVHMQASISRHLPNSMFALDVPSNCTCRTVLLFVTDASHLNHQVFFNAVPQVISMKLHQAKDQ